MLEPVLALRTVPYKVWKILTPVPITIWKIWNVYDLLIYCIQWQFQQWNNDTSEPT